MGSPHAPDFAHQIFKDAVHDFLVKAPGMPIRGKVELQRLAFDAELVWHVADVDGCEIGLAGDRAHRCELRAVEIDPVAALLEPVGKSFERF